MLKNLNSDDLRRQLGENNAAMNTLMDDNQKIVELMAQRGLQAIDFIELEPQLFRTQFEPKRREEIALTVGEIKAGGWFCEKVDKETVELLRSLGVSTHYQWDVGKTPIAMSTASGVAENHPRCFLGDGWKQIHRRGNIFYRGAPSD